MSYTAGQNAGRSSLKHKAAHHAHVVHSESDHVTAYGENGEKIVEGRRKVGCEREKEVGEGDDLHQCAIGLRVVFPRHRPNKNRAHLSLSHAQKWSKSYQNSTVLTYLHHPEKEPHGRTRWNKPESNPVK